MHTVSKLLSIMSLGDHQFQAVLAAQVEVHRATRMAGRMIRKQPLSVPLLSSGFA